MNTRIQDNNTNHGGSFLLGLITGSAIGAGLVVYFAPRLALELRQRVTDSTTGLRNAASERVQGVATRVADVVERVADVADDVTRRGQAARMMWPTRWLAARTKWVVVRARSSSSRWPRRRTIAPRDRDHCGVPIDAEMNAVIEHASPMGKDPGEKVPSG
jgi:gas vesicle protein